MSRITQNCRSLLNAADRHPLAAAGRPCDYLLRSVGPEHAVMLDSMGNIESIPAWDESCDLWPVEVIEARAQVAEELEQIASTVADDELGPMLIVPDRLPNIEADKTAAMVAELARSVRVELSVPAELVPPSVRHDPELALMFASGCRMIHGAGGKGGR